MNYAPPFLHKGSHFSTIIPNILRPTPRVQYTRVTIDTEDDDFIDVDVRSVSKTKAVLLLHGLEGSSQSKYIIGIGNALVAHGYTVIAMNYRGCSGRDNLQARTYHSGNTEDVYTVLHYFKNTFQSIDIIGFSLGGNIALKLAAENTGQTLPFSKIISVSAPVDLAGCAQELAKPTNYIYLTRFLGSLKRKAISKSRQHPSLALDENRIKKAKTFEEFDEIYTAPIHGFKSAQDYYRKCSSLGVLNLIRVPTLLVNARNDTFLSDSCYPSIDKQSKSSITCLYPHYGGHVGFAQDMWMKGIFWHEKRILDFLNSQSSGSDHH